MKKYLVTKYSVARVILGALGVVRGMQTYAECCAEGFISIRSTEQVQVNYKDKDKKNDI